MKHRTVKWAVLMVLFLLVVDVKFASASNSVDAEFMAAFDSGKSSTANVDYGTGAGKKLGRGLSNAAFGWLEFPKGIQDVGDQNNFIAGLTWGPISGLGKAVVRTVAGVYEVATFPVPLPKNFEPVVQPEFTLGDQW